MRPDDPPGTWTAWTESAPCVTEAEAVFAHLYGDRPVAVWLDSAQRAYGSGRFSILGAPEGPRDHVLAYRASDGSLRIDGEDAGGGRDLWDVLGALIDRNPVEPLAGLPFAGGYVGSVGYGVKDIGARSREETDARLVHLSRFLVVDHVAGRLHAVATGPAADEPDARAWIARALARAASAPALPPPTSPPARGAAASSVSRERYLDDVALVRSWLEAGDSYEACYTYRLELSCAEEPFEVYRRLRRRNPAPYASYLRLGGVEVLSCSPERYLQVSSAGWAETKPIKGTARRADDPAVDERIARELAQDPKTRSENLMIVDLLRNDLGRICGPGTVRVPQLMAVETYASVHQLVTTVRGRLLPRPAAAVHAAGALFPPGSMTGAPKQRTVELLDATEAAPRGAYSGVVGAFSRCGAADLAVVIRTAVVRDGVATIGTGGAITIESDPVAELDETVAKSTALLRAFGCSHPFERA